MFLCRLAIQISKSDSVSDFLCRRKTARAFTRPQSLCQEVFSLFFSKPSAAHRHPRTHAKKIATAQPPPDGSFNFPTFFFSKEPDCLLPSTSAPTALFPVESGAPFSRLPLHCQLFFFGFALFFQQRATASLSPPRLTTTRRSAGLKCRCSGPPRGRRQSASGRGVPSLYIGRLCSEGRCVSQASIPVNGAEQF